MDLGDVRTGIAVSDPDGLIARPLDVVPSADLTAVLRRLVGEEGVSEIVVGVPKTLGGEVGFQARKVLNRLGDLRKELPGVRFVTWDERHTTRLALAETRVRGGKQRAGRGDHLAVARMLTAYLGSRGASAELR